MEKRRIYLDTNLVLIPAQFKVDIFEEIKRLMDRPYELFVFDKTMKELDDLEKKGGKLRQEVKLTKILLKSKALNIVPLPFGVKTVDEGLLSLTDSIVATQDMALKRRLAAKYTKMIVLRQKKYLMMVN